MAEAPFPGIFTLPVLHPSTADQSPVAGLEHAHTTTVHLTELRTTAAASENSGVIGCSGDRHFRLHLSYPSLRDDDGATVGRQSISEIIPGVLYLSTCSALTTHQRQYGGRVTFPFGVVLNVAEEVEVTTEELSGRPCSDKHPATSGSFTGATPISPDAHQRRAGAQEFQTPTVVSFPLPDRPDNTIRTLLQDAAAFVHQQESLRVPVCVCCREGKSRSASVAIAYLMKNRDMDFNTALTFVRQRRASIDPNFGYCQELMCFDIPSSKLICE